VIHRRAILRLPLRQPPFFKVQVLPVGGGAFQPFAGATSAGCKLALSQLHRVAEAPQSQQQKSNRPHILLEDPST
jgi:hypothetical protein